MADDKKRRSRDESEELELPEVKRLREKLLGDDDDDDLEFLGANQELESFMKSLESEIRASPPPPPEVTADPGLYTPEIDFLLEASDFELGLPPPTASFTELLRVEPDGFSDFDPFGFGETGNYVDSFFDYWDVGSGLNGGSWIPETVSSKQ